MNKKSLETKKPSGAVVAFGLMLFLALVAPGILGMSWALLEAVLTLSVSSLSYDFLSVAYPWGNLIADNNASQRIADSFFWFLQSVQSCIVSGLFAKYTKHLPIKRMALLACATVLSMWMASYVLLTVFDVQRVGAPDVTLRN